MFLFITTLIFMFIRYFISHARLSCSVLISAAHVRVELSGSGVHCSSRQRPDAANAAAAGRGSVAPLAETLRLRLHSRRGRSEQAGVHQHPSASLIISIIIIIMNNVYFGKIIT